LRQLPRRCGMVNRAMCQWFSEFYHVRLKNADGSPLRCRANGRCKVWKREPARFRLPVKYGLRECFYLEPSNAHEWVPAHVWVLCEEYGLDPVTTPLEFLADRIEEDTSVPTNAQRAIKWRELANNVVPQEELAVV
jgi:hypothetical protein